MKRLLLSTTALAFRGGFFLILLFSFCFLCVHLIVYLLPKKQSKTPPIETEKEKAPPVTQAEPIYYIVERKKRRAKPQYSEPKEIKFQ
jgi:hypothetical protein